MVFAKESLCFGPICDSINNSKSNGMDVLGNILGTIITLFFTVAAFVMLLYMLIGGLEWITSGGDKEKIVKAQQKIQNALVGMVIVVVSVTIFGVVTGNILGIITLTPNNGWVFHIPTF